MYPHIEYTVLDPFVTDNQIDAASALAVELQVGGLCIPPYWVKKASREVAHTDVALLTIIGFPYGYQRTETKLAEMELAFADGATAIEVAINMSALKSQRINWIKAEVARFAHLVHAREAMLTMVADTDSLTNLELELFCKTCADAGADYIKIMSGYVPKAYSIEKLELALKYIPASVGVKVYTQMCTFQEVNNLLHIGIEKVSVPSLDFLKQQ
ncbi:deoxyribose-phosphate aldolase [Rhodocytophaga aerolata]|uniref:Deoxyribose-phosphate aldolase n=1 Tax=Rhodocytophaga aerolata TaxID=455078 RepID=A0ABT8R2Z6_9BACT|nr:deoxyribose-phosphate aldolase [Rhodocytophaga aerolata]MDO1445015.1 deoxyribose-phosphate aldolase [Rhodocytophaga aerolata]